MRILFFNRSPLPLGGGMNRMVIDTIRRLQAMGHEIALVHGRDTRGHFFGTGYIYGDLDRRIEPRGQSSLRLEAILEDFAPDVVQLHGVSNTLLDGWLAARCPTVRFIHRHTYYCSGGQLTLQHPTKSCTRAHGMMCRVNHVLRGCGSRNPLVNYYRYRAVSRNLQDLRAAQSLQVQSKVIKAQLLANGISQDRIIHLPPYAPPPSGSRHLAGFTARTVLHVGGLLGYKGVWMVVRMARNLPKDVQLVFAGGGKERQLLEAHVSRRGLGDRVRIVGEPTPEQWSVLYREATMVVMPVLWNEPLGLEGLSAMAYGKPVVAFDTGGIAEWITSGETGVLVPFGKKSQFRNEASSLLNDGPRLKAMGRRAREVWEQKFQPEGHLSALVAHYEKMRKERE